MKRETLDLLGITRPKGDKTPLWPAVASAIGAFIIAPLLLVFGFPMWTFVLFLILGLCATAVIVWRLAREKPHR